MIIKTEEQLEKMKEIGFICAIIRDEMKKKLFRGYLLKNWIISRKNYLKNMVQNQHQ